MAAAAAAERTALEEDWAVELRFLGEEAVLAEVVG